MKSTFDIKVIISKNKLKNNTYILYIDDYAVVIDPAFSAKEVSEFLKEKKLTLLAVLITHAHFDHYWEAPGLAEMFSSKIYISKDDQKLAEAGFIAERAGLKIPVPNQEIIFFDSSLLTFKNFIFKVIKAPGHSPGSVWYAIDDYLFTGDTIFTDTVGVIPDLPFYNEKTMIQTCKNFISDISDNVLIMPGHQDYGVKAGVIKKNNLDLLEEANK